MPITSEGEEFPGINSEGFGTCEAHSDSIAVMVLNLRVAGLSMAGVWQSVPEYSG
jgi:hypothetical protein